MAPFLLITTLLTMAGLIATMAAGFLASPAHVANHILMALGTVVIGLFSQSMTMFFFIGTGKQIKDHVKGSEREGEVRKATRALAMRVSPAATYAMLLLMVLFITGGGVATGKTPRWLHVALAIATLVLYARAYWIEIRAMEQNAQLMDQYLGD